MAYFSDDPEVYCQRCNRITNNYKSIDGDAICTPCDVAEKIKNFGCAQCQSFCKATSLEPDMCIWYPDGQYKPSTPISSLSVCPDKYSRRKNLCL